MKILSIDASSKSTGWSIFDNGELVNYGCITDNSTILLKRINHMIIELREIILNNNIEKIVLEEVLPDKGFKNLKTHKALMWLQGCIAYTVYNDCNPKIELVFIYPSSWRSKCGIATGNSVKREELKKRDIEFVKNKFGIEVNDDIADAIGIGYSYTREDKEEFAIK